MKLNDVTMDQGTLEAINGLIKSRTQNMKFMAEKGLAGTAETLMAEIVTVEVKIDALILALDRHNYNFENFNQLLTDAAKAGQQYAGRISEIHQEMHVQRAEKSVINTQRDASQTTVSKAQSGGLELVPEEEKGH